MKRRYFLKLAGLSVLALAAPKTVFAAKDSGNKAMKQIFEPLTLHNLKLKNRLVRSATWEGIAARDGSISDDTYAIYEELAKGGIGAIITGNTSVSYDDLTLDGTMRLSSDSLIPQYQKLVEIIHKHDCAAISQLALGGYYRSNGSTVNLNDLTDDEINGVIKQFKEAAARAAKAGFDGVQIHAAHSFFLSRFINPAYNHRHDGWGGSTENRTRILVEIINSIREVAPKLHITLKINSGTGAEEMEVLEVCKILAKAGIDSMEISGNNTSRSGINSPADEGYFADFAAKLAKQVKTPIYVVGGMRSKEKMEQILADTDIQMLSLSRPLLREPDLPNLLKSGKSTASKCVSCNACFNTPQHRCIFRR